MADQEQNQTAGQSMAGQVENYISSQKIRTICLA